MASLNQGTVNMWALCVTKDKSKSITSSDGNILRYLYGGKIKRLDHDAVDIASTVISVYACGTSLFFFFFHASPNHPLHPQLLEIGVMWFPGGVTVPKSLAVGDEEPRPLPGEGDTLPGSPNAG